MTQIRIPAVFMRGGTANAVVHEVTRATDQPDSALRIGMPAGVTTAAALVRCQDGVWVAERGSFLRTQRRLFEGSVLVRAAQAAPVARLV